MDILAVVLIVLAATFLVGRRAFRSARALADPPEAGGSACGDCDLCDGESRTAPEKEGEKVP
jgi:hypothetical protein